MRSLAGVIAALVCLAVPTAPAHAERPRTMYVPTTRDVASMPAVVNSKTIFANRCTGGCKVTQGFTDSRTNKSAIGGGTLSAFSYGDSTWNGVMACLRETFEPFNVTVTDVDPGPDVDHFEVMIAGEPGQLGLPNFVGGIAESACSAPGVCSKYIPNALVFAFASVWGNDVDELCATAAQELAHTWSLDHVIEPSDPMTYNQYSGMRTFKDNVRCGSDCSGGVSPSNETCVNYSGPTYSCSACAHTCMSNGQQTQNDVQILTALFGPAGAQAPTLKLTNPTDGSAQPAGFQITAECTSSDGIQEVNLSIDGVPRALLTAPPFTFTAPANLAEGPHKVSVLCATTKQAIAIESVNVVVGQPCPCAQAGYVCWDGACIAGPEAPGGLGAACMDSAQCVSGTCASDGTVMACVIPCDLDTKNCPDGFGCLEAGAGGVCWYGADDGGGCCDTSGGNGAGSMLLALAIAATFVTRRRRGAR